MLCVLMKILSHASKKKKTKRLKGFKFRTFMGRSQVTTWSEGVNSVVLAVADGLFGLYESECGDIFC